MTEDATAGAVANPTPRTEELTLTMHTRPYTDWLRPALIGAGLVLVTLAVMALAGLLGVELTDAAGPSIGAVTLAQAALLSPTPIAQGVVETFIILSSVLDRIPLKPIAGNSYKYNQEATLPGVEFRALNAAYAESTGTVVQATESLVILGGDADVDTFLLATSPDTDHKANQTIAKVKAATYKFQDTFINGDVAVDANAFDGLKKRLTGGQVVSFGTNGLAVVGAGDQAALHAFLDKLDELIAAVPGLTAENGALYVNDLVKAKIMSNARRAALYSQTVDDFGKTTERYRGIPIEDIGLKADGSRVIPQTETQGASSVSSSIYAVKYGEDEVDRGVTGLYNGPAEVFDVRDLGELQLKPSERVRIEGFVGVATFGGRAAARGTGILAS